MAILKDIKFLQAGGLDSDSAIEYRAKNDYFPSYNTRITGTQQLEDGYITNIESNQLLSASIAPGINQCIGSAGFESARFGLAFYYNSGGNNQIREINYDTGAITITPINYPLNPEFYVTDIKLINNTFLAFNDGFNPPAYVNYNRLKAGETTDLSLIKAQPTIAANAVYHDDLSRSVNLLAHILFQFRYQYIGLDYEASVDGTISQLFIPEEESTPEVGTNVTKNNNLWVGVDAGTSDTSEVVVDARYGGAEMLWFTVKSTKRADILLLPLNIDLAEGVYEAYDPSTNLYTFVFYNDGLYINKAPTETDQLFDAVPLVAGAMTVLNGNQLILSDITTGYNRPVIDAKLAVTNYNPNLTVFPIVLNPMAIYVVNPGQSGSGAGGHRRIVELEFDGSVQEGDFVTIVLVDIRNASSVQTYVFQPATFGEVGNTPAYIGDNYAIIPGSSTYLPGDGRDIGIEIITDPFFTLQSAYVTLFNAGSGVFKSIHALKLNSAYQVAIAFYDKYGRPFPLVTDGGYIQKTDSYGQTHGQTPQITVTLTGTPPEGAVTYQPVISPNNTHLTDLYTLASILSYQGTWDATANMPALSSGVIGGLQIVGHTYKVTTPGSQNLGNGLVAFTTGDFIVYNGLSWDIVPKSYGDISNTENYYFYLNSLNTFNTKNNTSQLAYDFSVNDRCTLAYYQVPGGVIQWFDGVMHPVVDVEVVGYDAATFFLKVNKSSAINPTIMDGANVLIELYSPKKRVQSDGTETEQVYFETGQVYTITNGAYDTPQFVITQGDAYFQVQELTGSVDTNTLYPVLVENFNFSPFYPSQFWSKGRPRAFDDVLERSEHIANMAYSEQYVVGSKVNGLTRFFPENIYGNQGGQTSSQWGRILAMEQMSNGELLFVQETNYGTIPVYANIIEDQVEFQQLAISEKILGNVRYSTGKNIGIGQGKRTFTVYNNTAYWIDSNRSEPIRWSGNGAIPITGKMNKYFKTILQTAYAAGVRPIGYYDIFNDEYIIAIPQNGQIVQFAFSSLNWLFSETFSVLPGDITITRSPSHSSPSYNPMTGILVLSPSTDYVGSDSLGISFPGGSKNVCFNWISGSGTVNGFHFFPKTGQTISTLVQSNTIGVSGNDYPVAISITGDTGFAYSINGGAFVSTPGTVKAGDIVQVEVQASASISTMTTCTLTIDGQSDTFEVTTNAGGNFTVSAQYGLEFVSLIGSGVPAAYTTCSIMSGNSLVQAYTTLAIGDIQFTVHGTPVMPVQVTLYENGVAVSFVDVPFSANYILHNPNTTNDPTPILIGVDLK